MKAFIFFFIVLLIIPVVLANHNDDDDNWCLLNLGDCLPDILYDLILGMVNAPLLPTLLVVKKLLTMQVDLEILKQLWNIVRYALSFFYLFFFVYAGGILVFSNGSPLKRAHAKEVLQNAILLLVLVQGSFYIYQLALNTSSSLALFFADKIDPRAFLITIDNVPNVALELVYSVLYLIVLSFTSIFLVIRLLIAIFGVVLFPLALFCYFFPPLRSYGRFLLKVLAIFVFITLFDVFFLYGVSLLFTVGYFLVIKMLFMMSAFLVVNYTLYYAVKVALHGVGADSIKDDLNQAVKYIALLI
ncbi:hypothetical protein HYV86_06920 [Candidatus Woesearchaeota archaeon]|nr:hypothetical protein [Candidatus Woesearchaeota archaeon]